MPSVSGSQHGFAGCSKSPKCRRKLIAKGKKPMPIAVATEYLHADKGRHFKKKHVSKRS